MAKPTLPTRAEMRAHCRASYGHWSNLSREWLKQRTSAAERLATYGYAEIDRAMAEVWEDEFWAKPQADQDALLDWYIAWYHSSTERYDGRRYGDPAHEDPRYALAGYVVVRWTDPTVCGCAFQVVGAVPGAAPDVWLRTHRAGPEHAAVTGQALRDTVHGESSRKSAVLALIEATIDAATREDKTTWAFTAARLAGIEERVLEVTIASTPKPQRDLVQGAADVQFGSGAVVVL